MLAQLGQIDVLFVFSQHVEEALPDLLAEHGREFGVVQGELDARAEGFAEGADAVAGEDEDSFVIFEDSEEDCVWLVEGRLRGERALA